MFFLDHKLILPLPSSLGKHDKGKEERVAIHVGVRVTYNH